MSQGLDKSWMTSIVGQNEYVSGVKRFINFALSSVSVLDRGLMRCPCIQCANVKWYAPNVVEFHCCRKGMMPGYKIWRHHGETNQHTNIQTTNDQEYDEFENLVNDAFGYVEPPEANLLVNDMTPSAKEFYDLVADGEEELYPGCTEFSKLSFVVRLFHIKCQHGISNIACSKLLSLFKKALPKPNSLPESFYLAKKMIKKLGLDYKKIDVCPKRCILYMNEHADDSECHVCHTPRWKKVKKTSHGNSLTHAKVPAGPTIMHFPLIPRLQRYFMSSKTSIHMRWHSKERIKDGVMRHPADSRAWKKLDELYPTFASEERNIRLGIATDGFNPFGYRSSLQSTWPVLVLPYNLPPWMCMKKPNILMSLLIPEYPGVHMDLYLQPLMEELHQLWEHGVDTFDQSTGQVFKMCAAVLWTISDFPGYALLSRYSTKGYLACPNCRLETSSICLKHGQKIVYMGSRRNLPLDHAFRYNRCDFDGFEEHRTAPQDSSGEEILKEAQTAALNNFVDSPWKGISVFFTLPYWKHNLIRHNLDGMHIEKNVTDKVLNTLMDNDASRDNIKSRLDLQLMGVKSSLHPIQQPGSDRVVIPTASYTLSKANKEKFLKILKAIRVPDGYSSNIRRRINLKEKRISGLKSHDCHILMQQFLPIAVRKTLPKHVSATLVELSSFFANICLKNLQEEVLLEWEKKVPLILCKLEMIFPPSFFDIMVHLIIHLTRDALLGRNIHFRWMYPIERYLGKLRTYVKNRNRIEASIAEGYVAEECLDFCSRYLNTTSTLYNTLPRNYRDERPMGSARGESYEMTSIECIQAHRCILQNCHNEDLENYMRIHEEELRVDLRKRKRSARNLQQIHHMEFYLWLSARVIDEVKNGKHVPTFVQRIADVARLSCRRYKGYFVNGYRFRVECVDNMKVTQNCGVMQTASTRCYSSVNDQNPTQASVQYYGILTDVIEVSYGDFDKTFTLFKCKWVSKAGIKRDDFGMTLVSFDYLMQSHRLCDEPFIFAHDASQVFYVDDDPGSKWLLVVGMKPRDLYDMGERDFEDDTAIECEPINLTILDGGELQVENVHQEVAQVSTNDINSIMNEGQNNDSIGNV